jgi:hypothetical protein
MMRARFHRTRMVEVHTVVLVLKKETREQIRGKSRVIIRYGSNLSIRLPWIDTESLTMDEFIIKRALFDVNADVTGRNS